MRTERDAFSPLLYPFFLFCLRVCCSLQRACSRCWLQARGSQVVCVCVCVCGWGVQWGRACVSIETARYQLYQPQVWPRFFFFLLSPTTSAGSAPLRFCLCFGAVADFQRHLICPRSSGATERVHLFRPPTSQSAQSGILPPPLPNPQIFKSGLAIWLML